MVRRNRRALFNRVAPQVPSFNDISTANVTHRATMTVSCSLRDFGGAGAFSPTEM